MSNQDKNYELINLSVLEEVDVMQLFHLKIKMDATEAYKNWVSKITDVEVTNLENNKLATLCKKLNFYIRGWNETELREKFIAQIVEMIDFDNPELAIAAFSERFIEANYENKRVRGKADLMVANGEFRPEKPFFFLHEYKKKKDSSNDPVGQMLGAMCVSQLLNLELSVQNLFQEGRPLDDLQIFGCYVLGRFWFFSHLDWQKQHYYISKAYDATDEADLQIIYKMLKAQKEIIFDYMRSLQAA